MVFKLAPSSLHQDIKTAPQVTQNRYKRNVYALPGLIFNPNALKVRKTAQFQLSHLFRDKKRLVIWHDVVNNSLSRHQSNNNKPLTPSQLISVLENYQERIEAIVYCPREGTPDIYDQVKRSALVTIHLVKDNVSRRKQKDPSLLKKYRALHQRPARSRPKKLSMRRRKTLRTRHAFDKAELTEAFDNLNVT